MRRPLILIALLVAAAAVYHWLGPEAPDLAWLRGKVAELRIFRAEHPGTLIALFFLGYVLVVALSLPLAVWMTLAAGALFGFWTALILVSFAATVGATLAFLAARYCLRDWVRARFGERLKAIDQGIERDGAFYLFALRLIPAVPFFAVNLAMGLTNIGWITFFLVSQVGMLAGTAVYVNAGTQLAHLHGLRGILSLPLLLSFVLLGLFPWLARAAVAAVRRRRIYAKWPRPRSFDRNLVVIGAGAAGLVSAYIAAAVRAKVTLVEAGKMGGDCLNYGCVPSKALIRSAKLAHQMRNAGRYGLHPAEPGLSFPGVFARIRDVVAAIAPHDSVARYEGLGVDVRRGHARILDPWTVEISPEGGDPFRLTTRSIIVASGAEPFVPPLPGLDQVGFLTTDTMWDEFARRDSAPKRLVVLGGGPVGCELAQSFARLGCGVTQIEMAPRLLLKEDEEVSAHARQTLVADGVGVRTASRPIACGTTAGEKWIEIEAAGVRERIGFDDLIVAVGRTARLQGFGLEELGIPAGRVIETNEYLETLYPNIFAAGDAAGPYQLTHVAAHQAWFAAVNALFGFAKRFKADYRVIPWVTFLDPEIGRVGLSEAEAQEAGVAYEVTRYDLGDLDRAIADGAAAGFVKVLTAPGRDRILGVTIVGDHAGELLAEFVLAMKHRLGLGKILATIHSYPTLAEANKFAAGEWRKAHVNQRALGWLEWLHARRRGKA